MVFDVRGLFQDIRYKAFTLLHFIQYKYKTPSQNTWTRVQRKPKKFLAPRKMVENGQKQKKIIKKTHFPAAKFFNFFMPLFCPIFEIKKHGIPTWWKRLFLNRKKVIAEKHRFYRDEMAKKIISYLATDKIICCSTKAP